MIRTQVRCDKRVSFRDRREGWTCVCPSPGVARTHMATRTVSLRAGNPRQAWTRPSPTAPMRWRVLRSTNTGYNHAGSLRGFKATASSCGNSQTAHATHSTPSPPHSRQDHETPTSPQTPDNKLHHRHAKVFKPPLRQTPNRVRCAANLLHWGSG